MQTRVIMLVDLDYFFAQCEELRNPSLEGTPVVVCVYSGRSEDSGAVSTANYKAREYGVKSGMPIFLAKKKLENTNATFLPVDHAFYEEISEKVMDILKSYADLFEQAGIDEAYLDVTKRTDGKFQNAKKWAEKTKGELRAQLKLSCSIGVGPNKLVAKIAADTQKPDGLTIIEPEQVGTFLSPMPVRRLIGVGVKTEERMQALGIKTISDLTKYDVQKLAAIFGKTLATYFHNASLGIDDQPIQETGEAESISRISTLKEDTRDMTVIIEKADQLCSEIHDTVVNEKLSFKTVGIIAVMIDMSTHTRSRTLENFTNSLEAMKKTVKELFEKLLNETELAARRVGVKVSNFGRGREGQRQLTTFMESAEH